MRRYTNLADLPPTAPSIKTPIQNKPKRYFKKGKNSCGSGIYAPGVNA
jgi:hypothetical protein